MLGFFIIKISLLRAIRALSLIMMLHFMEVAINGNL